MMGRGGDWSLLGGSDPAPGCVEDVQRISMNWGDKAGKLSDAQNLLERTHVAGSGASVEAARTLLARDGALLKVYGQGCENLANGYKSWTASLQSFQDEADRLLTQAHQANDDLNQGHALVEAGKQERIEDAAKRSLPEAITEAAIETILPGLAQIFSDTRGQYMINDAQQRLDHLNHQADDLRERYKAEGDRIATTTAFVTSPAAAAYKAGLDNNIPIGPGSLAALIHQDKNPKLTKLDALRKELDSGNSTHRQEYLNQLGNLTPEQLVLYGLMNPGQARNPLVVNPGENVNAVKSWWSGLDEAKRNLLIATMPGIVGNLNGIPYADRGRANKTNIELIDADPGTSPEVHTAIQKIKDALKIPDKQGALRSLISFDLNNGKPLGAIAIGNMDKAKNVTWNVPGMGTTLSDGIESWTKSAQDLYKGQYAAMGYEARKQGVVVVSWVGYETPDKPPSSAVLSMSAANTGAEKLQIALDGFQDTRGPGSGYHLNVVAHSYGTTTSSVALTHTKYPVDTVCFFGSAGIDPTQVPQASLMHVAHPGGQPAVYVTHAGGDNVAPLGIYGSQLGIWSPPLEALNGGNIHPRFDPTEAWFGAHTFSSEGGYDADGTPYYAVNGHDANGPKDSQELFFASKEHGYLDLKTESAHNIALITTGQEDKIQPLIPLTEKYIDTGHGLIDQGPDETHQSPEQLKGKIPRKVP
ncbi:hypothetical protein FHU41_000136 [Psychromicrobium silvestre]|uniref:DUF1023 domain-containing protein n=1 Tax=Psychromicrobium silvestre TaxID=1645614 RepID=A0A7Y9LQU8_9MICC|nr:alpha/beta hydrolase [Psychromicrobium silvestre]NYE93915.1 hypothetical protein [Psychromicrobium silvestre]